jgi:hypothetical protein
LFAKRCSTSASKGGTGLCCPAMLLRTFQRGKSLLWVSWSHNAPGAHASLWTTPSSRKPTRKHYQPLLAPRKASMQFGPALRQRIFTRIVHADRRYGPVHLAKIDIAADSFYRVWLQVEDIPKLLGVALLPSAPGCPPWWPFLWPYPWNGYNLLPILLS